MDAAKKWFYIGSGLTPGIGQGSVLTVGGGLRRLLDVGCGLGWFENKITFVELDY